MLNFAVNGADTSVTSDPRTPLLEVLRESLHLTGTKYGCGEGECGACTVIIDGKTVCSCLTLAGSAEGREITTIEGMGNDPVGVSLIKNLAAEGAVQCGFCTPGFVMQGWSAVASGAAADDAALRDALGGNLCRCTGYSKILTALRKSGEECSGSPLSMRRGNGVATGLRVQGYWRPTSLDDLLVGLADQPEDVRFAAGCTDLAVQNQNRLKEIAIVDLAAIAELRGIVDTGDCLRIGALTTWTDIIASADVATHAPLLGIAAREVGARQIQNRGTIGGNIANASPAADGLPPLYAYDALIVVLGAAGERLVPIADFVLGPGKIALARGELISEIRIPKPERRRDERFFFLKIGSRKAQTISKASVAFHDWIGLDGNRQVRVAIGAVAPTVLRVSRAESLLAEGGDPEAAAALLSEAASPITDLRSTAGYRRDLLAGLLLRGLLNTQAG